MGRCGGSIQVERPIGLSWHGRHGQEPAAHLFQSPYEVWVRRGQHQHAVTRRAGKLDQDADRLDRVRQDPQLPGSGIPAVPRGHPGCPFFLEQGYLAARRVPEVTALGEAYKSFDNGARRREVHVGDPAREHPVISSRPLHPRPRPQPLFVEVVKAFRAGRGQQSHGAHGSPAAISCSNKRAVA